jgi:branched-chain amino acid transport system substrate-binding protein
MSARRLAPLMLIFLAATACQSGPTPSPSVIYIASDLPTSATSTISALSLQRAIQLAIDQHPNIGHYKLVYMPLDDTLAGRPSPEQGIQNVKGMIADAQVLGMIGPYGSTAAFGEIPLANAAGLVMLSPSVTNACLTQTASVCDLQLGVLRPSGSINFFRTVAPDPTQGRAMARFAADSLGVKKVAAFAEGPTEDLILNSFEAELTRRGGTLVFRADLPPGTSNFNEFLRRARASGAQAIYAATQGDNACAARAQMKGILPDGANFLGFDGIYGPDCIAAAANSAEGMIVTATDVDLTHIGAALKKGVDAYRKAYPDSSDIAPYTFAAYDCALILIDAIKHAIAVNGGAIPSRLQVVNAVAHAQFTGVTGTHSFDANGDPISPLMSIYEVQNGRWVYQQQIDASPS